MKHLNILRKGRARMEKIRTIQIQELFENKGIKKRFSKKEYIYHIGEPLHHVYFIKEGWVKTSRELAEGKESTFFLRKEGNVLGLTEVFAESQKRVRSARCLTECTVYSIQTQLLYHWIGENHNLYSQLLNKLAQNLMDTRKTCENLINQSVTHRLAFFLTSLADKSREVILPISHEEISHLIGCSRQTVTELLNSWDSKGLISYQRKHITLLKPDSLLKRI